VQKRNKLNKFGIVWFIGNQAVDCLITNKLPLAVCIRKSLSWSF